MSDTKLKTRMPLFWHLLLGVLLTQGCGRSVTLHAPPQSVTRDLQQLEDTRARKEAVLYGTFVGGVLLANAATSGDGFLGLSEEEVMKGAITAGVLASAVYPDAILASFTLVEFKNNVRGRQEATFARDPFRAVIRYVEQDQETTEIRLYIRRRGSREQHEQDLRDFLEALETLGASETR